MKKCKNIYTFLACGMSCILLTGCQTDNPQSPAGTSPAKNVAAAPAAAEDTDYSELFSDRDLSGEYEPSEAVDVTLTGSSAVCESSDVTVDGSVITITGAGTYMITGTLDDGMIIVDTDKESKVQLVLNGMSVNSSSSAAIYVRQADKVFITTSKNSENTLSNGGVYESDDENNIDAAIFSKDDLTLNGSGKLTINAAAGHGVVSKDDLIITGGAYTITSEKDGLSGKDIVGIADGTFTIASSGDGISSDADLYIANGDFSIVSGEGSENGRTHRDEFFGQSGDSGMNHGSGKRTDNPDGKQRMPDDMTPPDGTEFPKDITLPDGAEFPEDMTPPDGAEFPKDMTLPDGAEFSDTPENSYDADDTDTPSAKGLKCAGSLTVAGGNFSLNCADDALHADANLLVLDGVFHLASGDDGLHADGSLTVKNGTITVSESYEGIEGAQITIDGGAITVYADDDGLNAAAGTDAQVEENCMIAINGGILKVIAGGDGIDSNGSLIQTGGEAYVCGPTDSANAALDFGTEIQFEGGIMIAVDDSRMQEPIENSPIQGVIRTETGSQSAGTNITITDENGRELLSFTPEKAYGTITVSHPDLKQGNNYIITAGNDVINISMDSLLYDDVSSGFGRP